MKRIYARKQHLWEQEHTYPNFIHQSRSPTIHITKKTGKRPQTVWKTNHGPIVTQDGREATDHSQQICVQKNRENNGCETTDSGEHAVKPQTFSRLNK